MAHPDGWVHGKDGRFLIGSTDFKVTDFDITWEVDDHDITHTGGNGAQVVIDGIERFDGTVNFVYNILAKPTVAPQQMKPRTYAVCHFKPDGADDFSATCLCKSFRFKSGPKAGEVVVTVAVRSTSAITSPAS